MGILMLDKPVIQGDQAMRYKTPLRQGRNSAPLLKRAPCYCVLLRACVLLAAMLTTSGCVGVTMGVSTLEPKWQLNNTFWGGVSAFMPMTGTDIIMPEFGVAGGTATGKASSPYEGGTFTEMYAGARIFAAPYDMSGNMGNMGNMAMQTAVPYVGAGLTFLTAELDPKIGLPETDSTLGFYVRVGMTMGEFFAVEGRYVLAPKLELFNQDLSLNGPQASVWIRLDVFMLIMLLYGDIH